MFRLCRNRREVAVRVVAGSVEPVGQLGLVGSALAEAKITAPRARQGLTMVELLLAVALLTMVLGVLQTVGMAVYQASTYNNGHSEAAQHARVALDRITRTANQAKANEQFPGFLVVPEQVGTRQFPDALVVWHPTGSAANPTGLPQFNELVIYCPSLSGANQLVEITVPNDTRTVPSPSNMTSWASEIAAIRASKTSNTVVLTNLLRTCKPSGASSAASLGAVRFAASLRPSDSDWSAYKAGTLAWDRLPWVQGIYGAQTGLRQSWVRIEIQLVPGDEIQAAQAGAQQPVPYVGSAAVYYQVQR
jgi:Flp pilus assembly protein TadG